MCCGCVSHQRRQFVHPLVVTNCSGYRHVLLSRPVATIELKHTQLAFGLITTQTPCSICSGRKLYEACRTPYIPNLTKYTPTSHFRVSCGDRTHHELQTFCFVVLATKHMRSLTICTSRVRWPCMCSGDICCRQTDLAGWCHWNIVRMSPTSTWPHAYSPACFAINGFIQRIIMRSKSRPCARLYTCVRSGEHMLVCFCHTHTL